MLHFKPDRSIFPVLPGDDLYLVDTGHGYTVEKEPSGVDALVVTCSELKILYDGNPKSIGEGFFLTREEAEKWADEHRHDPPYPYFDTALEWMPAATWKPGLDGFYWARLKDSSVVRCSFDSQAGVFMDEGHPLPGIMAWTSGFYSFEEAQQADEYESVEE